MTGRRWLRFDAVYCAGAGAIAIAASSPLARLFHVPRPIVVAIGAAAIVWALLLTRIARAGAVRRPLALVAIANAAAAAALAVVAVFAPGVAAKLLLAAVAVEVAAFATVQTLLVRRA